MVTTYEVMKALHFAVRAHKNQLDMGGVVYITHPITVAEIVQRYNEYRALTSEDKSLVLQTAYLHDVVEDTYVTFEDLHFAGFSKEVIAMVNTLTRKESESYGEYIDRLLTTGSPTAAMLKLADMTHNMDLRRLSSIGVKDVEKNKKYRKYFKIIKQHFGLSCTWSTM